MSESAHKKEKKKKRNSKTRLVSLFFTSACHFVLVGKRKTKKRKRQCRLTCVARAVARDRAMLGQREGKGSRMVLVVARRDKYWKRESSKNTTWEKNKTKLPTWPTNARNKKQNRPHTRGKKKKTTKGAFWLPVLMAFFCLYWGKNTRIEKKENKQKGK